MHRKREEQTNSHVLCMNWRGGFMSTSMTMTHCTHLHFALNQYFSHSIHLALSSFFSAFSLFIREKRARKTLSLSLVMDFGNLTKLCVLI